MPNAPSEPADPQAELKTKAVEFVMALCSPDLSDREVAWHGFTAILEASEYSSAPFDVFAKAVRRVGKIVG
jgi:hypothetical protein